MSDMAALASEHIQEAINLFKNWVEGRVRYTGRTKNANRMAKILPLFQGFVRDNAEFFRINFGYKWRGSNPGQLSPIYPLFRDHICLQALTKIRNDIAARMNCDPKMHVKINPSNLPPFRYVMKHTKRRDGQRTPRAIFEWVMN